MKSEATSVEAYMEELPADRKVVIEQLRRAILDNLPEGFQETISYGMIGYVVPHSLYPNGYHCSPDLPLPFINIASQKNFIALYHSGIYSSPELLAWFVDEYPKYCKNKLDMGKSCIRFKNINKIPFDLIGQLVTKLSVQEWVALYENARKVPAKRN